MADAAPPAPPPLPPSPPGMGTGRPSRISTSTHPPPPSASPTFPPASTLDGEGGEEEEAAVAERRMPPAADGDGTGTDGGDGDVVVVVDDDEIRDPLLPRLIVVPSSYSSGDATTDVRTALTTEGYCVIPSVLTREECTSFLDDMWDYVEVTSGGRVRRDDPTTYYPRHRGRDGDSSRDDGVADDDEDPWPCSGWGSFPDMFQTNGAGWLHGKLREVLASRVFGPLVFGTEGLHCSKEGFTFHRPRRYRRGRHACMRAKNDDDNEEDKWEWVNDCHPAYRDVDCHSSSPSDPAADSNSQWRRRGRTFRVCGRNQLDVVGEHFDQSSSCHGLCHVQSATSFLDQDQEDGCFLCWPGSHVYHRRLTEGTYRGKFPWVPLTDDDLSVLREGGLSPLRVHVKAGDVVLWRSDLVHAACSPSRRADGFRAVAYAAMMPAELAEESVRKRKLDGYRQIRTGDHRAEVEVWHDEGGRRRRRARSDRVNGKGADADDGATGEASAIDEAVVGDRRGVVFPPYFRHGPPPLTWRQAELCGLVPYGIPPDGRPDAIRRALGRGVRFVAEVEAEASSP